MISTLFFDYLKNHWPIWFILIFCVYKMIIAILLLIRQINPIKTKLYLRITVHSKDAYTHLPTPRLEVLTQYCNVFCQQPRNLENLSQPNGELFSINEGIRGRESYVWIKNNENGCCICLFPNILFLPNVFAFVIWEQSPGMRQQVNKRIWYIPFSTIKYDQFIWKYTHKPTQY